MRFIHEGNETGGTSVMFKVVREGITQADRALESLAYHAAKRWCEENFPPNEWGTNGMYVWFQQERHAILFKLRWG